MDNYAEICDAFHKSKIDFCYLPLRCKEKSAELLEYHNPSVKSEVKTRFTTAEFVNALFGEKIPEHLKSSVIIYNKYKSTPDVCRFLLVEFVKKTSNEVGDSHKPWWKRIFGSASSESRKVSEFEQMAMTLVCALNDYGGDGEEKNRGTRYSRVNWYDESYWEFMKQHHELIAEIDLRIHQLQERGVDSLILKKILSDIVDEHRPLSRMTITKDLRIVLDDYDGMEIRMEPINKAVFLLFLNHEDGISIKSLSDYRNELESFYTRLSHDDIEKRKKSIETLIDPTNNSINEKLSRIRQAFIARFEEDLAENYFITGARGEKKRIKLPRDMVTWE
ncbi:MAG: hypothetical protein ACI3YC_01240 [Alloprevotella sp.]